MNCSTLTIMMCFCCSDHPFSQCCEPFLIGHAIPRTAEQLMRSRYAAYCTQNVGYLTQTAHGSALATMPTTLDTHHWINLSIIRCQAGREHDDHGTVEFKAILEDNGTLVCIHEISQFKKISDHWYYTEGVTKETCLN